MAATWLAEAYSRMAFTVEPATVTLMDVPPSVVASGNDEAVCSAAGPSPAPNTVKN